MSETIIKAENLGKCYIIGHESKEQYTALRDVLVNKAKQIIGKTRHIFKGNQLIGGNELEEFWALKDINFEIRQGDRVGIIGRNGAGKSTLLKILSRITEPSTGRVQIRGRVASLLEVGTGFHPELSGRENIFLNGAILGMSRAEIRKKFDEIVDFSGVEKFLDTPVKRYSSGMYVRLAFAVAAHMEPEILVVDEVLAVGDAEFQKKCLGKMEDVSAKEGRTVIFVSHNVPALKNLCLNGILLQDGKKIFSGEINDVLTNYSKTYLKALNNKLSERTDRKGNGRILFDDIVLMKGNIPVTEVSTGDHAQFIIRYQIIDKSISGKIFFSLNIVDEFNTMILQLVNDEIGADLDKLTSFGSIVVDVPQLLLRKGTYYVNILIANKSTSPEDFMDGLDNALCFSISSSDFWKSGKINRTGSYCIMPSNMFLTNQYFYE